MSDSSFNDRLVHVIDELRHVVAAHPEKAVVDTVEASLADLDALANDLLELAGQMRGQADARSEDTSVEAKGFLAEAMEQYADRIDTADRRDRPSAGTSAYELIAAAEIANLDTTETLIQMTAATVLSVLIDEEGGGRSNISFSPADMDSMHKRYMMDAKRDGMLTVVSIKPREGAFGDLRMDASTAPAEGGLSPAPASLYGSDDPTVSGPAKPQADMHVYDRPLWAIRRNGVLQACSDRKVAERLVFELGEKEVCQVENRFCYHAECPAEKCLKAEVTSTGVPARHKLDDMHGYIDMPSSDD